MKAIKRRWENIRDIDALSLYELCNNPNATDFNKSPYLHEARLRNITGSSVECGKQTLKRLMDDWEANGKEQTEAAQLMPTIDDSLARESRKSMLTVLNSAKRKLEKVL